MSELPDSYPTLEDGPEIELKIKASRFIGQAFRATNEDEAKTHIRAVRKRYHDARHHCSAWMVGQPGAVREKSDDDGEPGSTAGPPILEAIRRHGTYETCVVVTRYFGGTKLGTGGLIRAYDEAAKLALDAAPAVTVWCDATLIVTCDYGAVGTVEAVLAKLADPIVAVDRAFDAEARFDVRVRRSRADEIRAALVESTGGRVTVSAGDADRTS